MSSSDWVSDNRVRRTLIFVLMLACCCIWFGNVNAQPDKQQTANGILFVSDIDDQPGVYVMNADGTNLQRFINSPFEEGGVLQEANLSPDGKTLAFTSRKSRIDHPTTAIFLLDVASGQIEPLSESAATDNDFPVWSPDGLFLAYLGEGIYGNYEKLYVWDVARHEKYILTSTQPLSNAVHDKVSGITRVDWSPDGQRLILGVQTSPPTGNNILVVINADGSDLQQVTRSDVFAAMPVWNWQSNLVYFLCELGTDNQICYVDIQGSGYDLETTDLQNRIPDISDPHIQWIDASDDGQLLIQFLQHQDIYIYNIQDGTLTKLPVEDSTLNAAPHWIHLPINTA